MAFSFFDLNEENTPQPPPCDHHGCPASGLYPAPKRNSNQRYHFCLEHVREYNKKWNYFDGYTPEEMYQQMQKDSAWDRPTWPSSIPLKLEARLHEFVRKFTKDTGSAPIRNTPVTKEAKALETLGLTAQADQKTIKTRYRELVKKYHPDKNPDNPKAAERFKIVAEAYMVLQTKNIESQHDETNPR